MDVSIIIVNYNTKDLTRNCLKSVYEHTKDILFEVIVSDNGSTDGSVEMIKTEFPRIILIENGDNLGFGAANNRALKVAKGKYVFYLNSDTIILNNAVKIFFDYWERAVDKEKIGALGAWLIKNNKIIHSYSNYPTFGNMIYTLSRGLVSSLFGKFKRHNELNNHSELKHENTEIKGYITGADLFLRNNDNAKFDERFFMYFEETDLQFNNFFQKNMKLILLEEPKIIHLEGGSDKKSTNYDFSKKSSVFYWYSCLIYFKKNYPHRLYYKSILKILIIFIYFLPKNFRTGKLYFKDFISI